MKQYMIMCRSLTYAQRAVRILERKGFYSSLARAPMGISPEGCTYGVKLRTFEPERVLGYLHASGIKTGKVYFFDNNGEAHEVTP